MMIEKRGVSLRDNHLNRTAQVAAIDSQVADPLPLPGQQVEKLVALLVSTGMESLENKQIADALGYFESALYLDPEHAGAQSGRNRVYRKLIPRWHFEMLNDKLRNDAFERVLAKAITGSTNVLDIGSGSGLLAMMAARAGARYTVTCEMIAPIAELARRTIALNGLGDKITVLDKKSTSIQVGIDMPRRADLLVTETVDCGLLGEGILASVAHARSHLLTEGARIIPCSASVMCFAVESEPLLHLNRASTAAGFDVSPINHFATAGYFPVRLGAFDYVPLTNPFEAFRFDFTADPPALSSKVISVPVKRDGVCHAFVFWFEMQLDDEISISNRPGSATHWEQALQCLEKATPVQAGKTINILAQHDCNSISFKLTAPS